MTCLRHTQWHNQTKTRDEKKENHLEHMQGQGAFCTIWSTCKVKEPSAPFGARARSRSLLNHLEHVQGQGAFCTIWSTCKVKEPSEPFGAHARSRNLLHFSQFCQTTNQTLGQQSATIGNYRQLSAEVSPIVQTKVPANEKGRLAEAHGTGQ
jgi:hypothetical protein